VTAAKRLHSSIGSLLLFSKRALHWFFERLLNFLFHAVILYHCSPILPILSRHACIWFQQPVPIWSLVLTANYPVVLEQRQREDGEHVDLQSYHNLLSMIRRAMALKALDNRIANSSPLSANPATSSQSQLPRPPPAAPTRSDSPALPSIPNMSARANERSKSASDGDTEDSGS